MAKWRFLWITDLHYELPDANYLDDAKELEEKYNWPLRENVFSDFIGVLEHGGFAEMDLSFIAIGGDVTTHGQQTGFTRFEDGAFRKLQDFVSPKAICVVPGNHDVVWGIDPTGRKYFDRKFEAFRRMIENTGVTSCLFPSGELDEPNASSQPGLEFKLPPNGPVYKDDDKRVLVLNVNSALRCGELNRQMLMDFRTFVAGTSATNSMSVVAEVALAKEEQFLKKYLIRDVAQVTQEQIKTLHVHMSRLRNQLADQWHSYLRVALVHHHVVHYPGQQTEHKGYEFMVDSPRLLEFLEGFDFDIVLTGHKHQAYQRVERFKKKDMFIIGGATIGGYTSEGRGFRLVEFETGSSKRKVRITDIETDFARGEPSDEIKQRQPIELYSETPTKIVVECSVARLGYGYREVASTTAITQDGDAHRTVECDDLEITKEVCGRASRHPLNLPPTSGYLDRLRATSRTPGFSVKPSAQLPHDHSAKSSDKIALEFDPKLTIGRRVSYRYDWLAVNSFALDELQFDRKYGEDQKRLDNVEFTHFIPKDPIEALTVVVEFPPGFKLPTAPRLRIARVDPMQTDARLWEIDYETTAALEESHALRFYESLNVAALRVQAPSAELSYGIEWNLPAPPVREGGDRLDKIVQHFSQDEKASLRMLLKVLEASRKIMLPGWEGELDGSLMVFEMDGNGSQPRVGKLKTVGAGRSPRSSRNRIEYVQVKTEFPYGLGIAGRAFKANRIRVYVAPKDNPFLIRKSNGRIEPDYYMPGSGALIHKALVALPLHAPVGDDVFVKNSGIYENREPYGVINIGSDSDECPVSRLLMEQAQQLPHFQHLVNGIMYGEVFRK